MTDAALRVRAVLADPLGVPLGLEHALRGMERGARDRRERLALLAARPDAAESVRAAAEEVARFLDDPERSPLLRALRRPLRQIAPDTPGGRSLQRCWDGLRARADAAVELQAALDGIRVAVAQVRSRFADALPRATRTVLAGAELDAADLARIGRADDVVPLHRRLRHAEQALERLMAQVDGDADVRPGASWDEEASPGELMALLRLRMAERAGLRRERDPAGALRRLAARQVRGLGDAGGWRRPARTPADAAAQRMGEMLLRGQAHARGGEDLALWDTLLGGASDTVFGAGDGGWAAQLPDAPDAASRETGSTRFVVPIDDTYALVTPHHASAVRVADRRVSVDAALECAVFVEHGDADTLPLARLDVQPLFDGLAAEPGWYATARRARLQVIAETADGWIARRVGRGELRRTRGEAWDAERGDGGRLRVLGTLAAPAPAAAWEVGPAPGAARTFCGVATVPVAAPLAECGDAWMRVAVNGGWAADAVRAEEACFRAVARAVPLTVPAWAGPARLSERRMEGPLYVPPFAVRAAELPPLDAWLRAGDVPPMLHAVARLWLRMTGAGYGLGVYHVDALAFSIGWTDVSGRPAAHAVATDAPFAAPLGRPYRAPPRDDALYPLYAGLGCRVLPPAVAEGAEATLAAEAQAFALFALALFAVRPLPRSGIVDCAALSEMDADTAACFASPGVALRLAAALRPGAAADDILDWIRRLADPPAAEA